MILTIVLSFSYRRAVNRDYNASESVVWLSVGLPGLVVDQDFCYSAIERLEAITVARVRSGDPALSWPTGFSLELRLCKLAIERLETVTIASSNQK